jgi:hypothetical protein
MLAVASAAYAAGGRAFPQLKPNSAAAHPAHPTSRHSHHKSKRWDITPDYRPRPDEAVLAQGDAAEDGGVSPYGCPPPNQGTLVF